MTALAEDQKKINTLQVSAMNSLFYISVSNSEMDNWKEQITSFLIYVEKEFSRFRQDNELWRFNHFPKDTVVSVSPIFYDLLQKSEEFRLKTGGRFSPFMLCQLEAHGYTQSFPFDKPVKEYEPHVTYDLEDEPISFHSDYCVTKKTANKVDLGGIAKGYAVEAIAKWLKKHGRSRYGIVDGGGDLMVWSDGEKTWRIGVMNPFNEDKEIGMFEIQNGAIATSNAMYRSWRQLGINKHHILDGRTGNPVDLEIVQATVVTRNCLDAEIGAKICFMDNHESVLSKLTNQFQYVRVKPDEIYERGGTFVGY